MKNVTGKSIASLVLALACAGLTGCLTENRKDSDTVIEGEVGGEGAGAGGSGSGFNGATVTLHPVSEAGDLGDAIDSATVKADGSFRLVTAARGARVLVLRVRLGELAWLALFSGDLRIGRASASRPIGLESTLEVEAWLQLLRTEAGRRVGYPEVAIAIDADVAFAARPEYRGAPAARAALVIRLAAAIRAAALAREAFLEKADSSYVFRRAAVDSARARAAMDLQVALHAAGPDTNKARAAERDYRTVVIGVYAASGVDRAAYARSAEAAYRALVTASVGLSDSVRIALARNYARLLAVALSDAVEEEFEEAGGSAAGLAVVVDAGDLLRVDLDVATGIAGLDSALRRFNIAVQAAILDSGSGLSVVGPVLRQAGLNNLVISLGGLLGGLLGGDAALMGEGYADAHDELRDDLLARLELLGGGIEVEAASKLLALLLLSPRAN